MWVSLRSIPCPICAFVFVICVAGTGASTPILNGAVGHSVSLHPSVILGWNNDAVWKKAPNVTITKSSDGNIKYYGPEEYKRRVTFHPTNYSLEIRDLQRDDAGDYELTVTDELGGDKKGKVRLEVYEPVSGTNITVQNIPGTCNLTLTCSVTSGNPTSFRWWRGGEAVRNDSTHHLWEHGETVEVQHTTGVEDVVYKCEARNPVSEGTAQIRLGDVCNITTPAPRNGEQNTVVSVTVGLVLLLLLIVGIVCFVKRRSVRSQYFTQRGSKTGENRSADTVPAMTVYAEVQRPGASRQPPEGNEMHHCQEEKKEDPVTVYDTVKCPGTPYHMTQ
ncbi:SLAM family member 5-like [Pristis pectinata]|uniref:SLAM family member 5-like n=1 Tax=Pristis pectinata TaxID=685728 RepID=UPI00223E2D26|nr:SLAM family member 5-like [Pristis pectinata]